MNTDLANIIPPKWKTDYIEGRMTGVIQFIQQNKYLSQLKYLNSGSTCVVWIDQSKKLVVKLCTKQIIYFKTFGCRQVKQFQHLINEVFKGICLPIKQVLYEDDYYFIYTQEQITVLNLIDVDQNVLSHIIQTVRTMFQVGALTCDLISSNFGWSKDHHLYLLDYHDLRPVVTFIKKNQWSKIVRCFMEYASYYLNHQGFEQYTGQSFINWKSEAYIIEQNFGSKYFPNYLVELFKSFSLKNTDQIIQRIDACLSFINKNQKPINVEPNKNVQSYPVIIKCDQPDKHKVNDDHHNRDAHHNRDDHHRHHNRHNSHNHHNRHNHHKRDDRHRHHKHLHHHRKHI